jgi:hypothetical protein
VSSRRIRAIVALATGGLTAAAALLSVTPAVADCGMQGPPAAIGAYRGIAVIGTVTANEPIDLLYQPSMHRSEQVAITLGVQRPIRGFTDDSLVVIGGEKGNCSIFWASELAVGDRVLLSFKPPPDEADFDLAPGAHIAWHALVWRPTEDGGWRFARGAVQFPEGHPAAAKAADSLSEILALVGPDLPPTDVAAAASAPGLTETMLGLAGLGGIVVALRRFRRLV